MRATAREHEAVPEATSDASEPAVKATPSSSKSPLAPKQPPVFDVTKEVGVTEPLGYFDPAGFCTGDRKNFRKLRAAELKHGRVAMMASVGLVAQHYIRFPVGIFDDVPAGISAPVSPNGGFGTQLLVFLCLIVEFVVWTEDPNKEPGDFGDPFGVGMYDLDTRNKEINNGRFAMIATMGICLAEFVSGKDAMQQFGLP